MFCDVVVPVFVLLAIAAAVTVAAAGVAAIAAIKVSVFCCQTNALNLIVPW